MTEPQIGRDEVREEHLKEVNVGSHSAYLFCVLIGGFAIMVALIALLGATAQ